MTAASESNTQTIYLELKIFKKGPYFALFTIHMIKHVVFFKFKPSAGSGERQAVLDELRALPSKIDVIREFEVGEDVLKSSRSWDAALVSAFDDLGTLQQYQRHDDHVPVAMKLQSLCDAIAAVDYEY